jgi:four helix bundle protein
MTKEDIQKLTKGLNIKIVALCESFPPNAAGFEIAKQIIRSSGSVGANYRAACRAKSRADFIYKLEIVIEEADETQYWLEVADEANLTKSTELKTFWNSYNEIVAILTASAKTAKNNQNKR